MSPIANGPIAMPHFSSALSTCCGERALVEQEAGLRPYCSSMRLPMKPSHTPETTGTFLIVLPSFMVVASTSFAGLRAAHDFQQPHDVGGRKKCVPITSCGRLVTAAISFTSSVEVLVARIAPGFITASSFLNTSCFTSMSSNTASMTMSASLRVVERRWSPLISAMRLSISSCVRRPLDTVVA